eukprot:m.195298 g.195298  ORF g.195298 m.195298 type:complete len:68 (+) comp13663_c0_seq29:2241-2444(+)
MQTHHVQDSKIVHTCTHSIHMKNLVERDPTNDGCMHAWMDLFQTHIQGNTIQATTYVCAINAGVEMR